MPFTIPNAANAEDVSQAQPDSVDFSILVAAFSGNGVVSGCAVTAQGTPNMTVAVAGGTVAVAGTQVAVTAGNVTIAAADPSNPRFSLICVDNAGNKTSVPGTAAAQPVFPVIPANNVVLAAVRVPAAAASINSQKITDKRVAAVLPAPTSFSTGMMMPWPTSAAPSGWQLCDGSAISRTTYANLFAIIGTTFGSGDNSTTFNVPDIQGRNIVGLAPAGHVDVNAVGKNEGMATVANRRPRHPHSNTLTLPNHAHVHTLTEPNHVHSDTFSFADTGHAHGVTNSLNFADSGHSHGINDNGHAHGPGSLYVDTTYLGLNGFYNGDQPSADTDRSLGVNSAAIGGTTAANGTGIGIQTAAAVLTKSGSVTVNTGNAVLVKSGSVGNPTTNPTINGAIGNPTSNPGIDGTIGAAGMANDSGAYIVMPYIIKL